MNELRDIAAPDPPVGRVVGLVLGLVTTLGLGLLLLAPPGTGPEATSTHLCSQGDSICQLATAATEVFRSR